MNEAEKNYHRLESARQVIEPFEVTNRHQLELKALLHVMMDHMERAHCQPGVPLDEAGDFDRWMAILKRFWRALKSPEMVGPQARTVLTSLLADAALLQTTPPAKKGKT